MTREEILNMPAGREMDALIWEHVFGFTPKELKDAPCPYCGGDMRFCGSRSWCSDCREWRHSPYKDFSDDIVAAWDVFEWLCVQGLVQMSNGDGDSSDVAFMPHSSTLKGASVTEDSFPLAICRAALLSVE